MGFEDILKRKIEYYGKTEAAYVFAAEEYAKLKVIEESSQFVCDIYENGNLSDDQFHCIAQIQENRVKKLG